MVEEAMLQARHACAIVGNLRDYIAQRETERSFEDINRLVEGAMLLGTVRAVESGARVEVALAPGLPRILANRVEIQQVLVNLFRNAMEAMRGQPRRVLAIATEMDGPDAVMVSVSDSGPGIDPDILARLFQPFATGKANGVGLGLRICQSIVEAHEGRIWAAPNADGGVTFRFRLPVIDLAELD
jgi:two-component system sensor kinase FixL